MDKEFATFIEKLKNQEIELYNEFGLQFELAIYLRNLNRLANWNIDLERPIGHFGVKKSSQIPKKEIDICVYNKVTTEKYAIEIKFSKHGQVPLQMFEFCKDICFLEQLRFKGFTSCYSLVIVDRNDFFEAKREMEGIYEYFRGEKLISGIVVCPTGNKKDSEIYIEKEYKHDFKELTDKYFYSLVKI